MTKFRKRLASTPRPRTLETLIKFGLIRNVIRKALKGGTK